MSDTGPNTVVLGSLPAGTTDTRTYNVVAGAAVVPVIGNNPNRTGLVIMNLSADYVYVNFTPAVNDTNGIVLLPNGGNVNLHYWEDFDLTGFPWYALSAGTDSPLFVLETFTY